MQKDLSQLMSSCQCPSLQWIHSPRWFFWVENLNFISTLWMIQVYDKLRAWICGLMQRLLKMVDGLNFKDFVAFLSAFSAKASLEQKVGRKYWWPWQHGIYKCLFLLIFSNTLILYVMRVAENTWRHLMGSAWNITNAEICHYTCLIVPLGSNVFWWNRGFTWHLNLLKFFNLIMMNPELKEFFT